MINPKNMAPIVLVIIYSIISNCESISTDVFLAYPPQTKPSYPPGSISPDPISPSPVAVPVNPSVPTTPYYLIPIPSASISPVPSLDFYPPISTSPYYPSPIPPSTSTSPIPSPNFYPSRPATPYYPSPSPTSVSASPVPSPNFYPPIPAIPYYPSPSPPSASTSPVPSPASYPPIPATPSYMNPSPAAVPISPPMPMPSPLGPPAPAWPPPPFPPPPYPSPPYYKGIKGAYWPSFTGFEASSIDTSYFTHIYYAFLLPDPVTFKLSVTPFDQQKIPGFIETLSARKQPVQTLISMGGGGNDTVTAIFANMSKTKETRENFINSTIEVARNYGFDGLDLDWEFPADYQEMFNLELLLSEWHEALVHEARTSCKPRLLLTAAVYYSPKFTTYGLPRSYPVDAINKYVDWVNPMCYDYHGSWENFTGPNAALYDTNSTISTSFGIGAWIQSGMSPKKLVMGLPMYGRTWKLLDPNVHSIGAQAVGAGPGNGTLNYNEILEFNGYNNAIVNFDGQTVSYYSYAGDIWIGYDDSMSIEWKVQFALSRNLGGYFFWALGQDKDWTISRLASNAWGN